MKKRKTETRATKKAWMAGATTGREAADTPVVEDLRRRPVVEDLLPVVVVLLPVVVVRPVVVPAAGDGDGTVVEFPGVEPKVEYVVARFCIVSATSAASTGMDTT
jgi:hypothetical protein